MKRSRHVHLVLLGSTVGLGLLAPGCRSAEADQKRDVYASQEGCQKDWGEADCTPERATGSGGGRALLYYGPLYTGTRTSRYAMRTEVVRGGFGRTGRSGSARS